MQGNLTTLAYLIASICFIMSLRGLSSAKTSKKGNLYGIIGMFIAVFTTIFSLKINDYYFIIVGIIVGGVVGTIIAKNIKMTALPQLVAAFHSLVGLSAVCVAASALYQPESYGISYLGHIKIGSLVEMSLGVVIGAITFTGSVIAFAKLQGIIRAKPLVFSFQHLLNLLLGVFIIIASVYFVTSESYLFFWLIVFLAFLLGFLLILPIGGADMPVIVSLLNSYSGWAAVGIGFTLQNNLLIITGALVGASGAILSYIMCRGMNRSIISVVLGGFGGEVDKEDGTVGVDKPVKSGNAEDAAFILQNANSIIIVPGYGMAVAQSQHALKEITDILKKQEVRVRYAIHPVAGRMPGHMNVLLAEAGVPYDDVKELEDINRDFFSTDVALVIGANDVTNPSAKKDKNSPIYGMPILDVGKSKTVLFIKRSLSPGYAGIDNELFYSDNTIMLFGDAKKVCEGIIKSL